MKPMHDLRVWSAAGALAAMLSATCASAGPIIVSGNDGKSARVEGAYKVDQHPVPDTLVVMDAATFPPRIVGQVEVHHGVIAPPTSVAITPDHSLALLAVPNRVDPADPTKLIAESFLQVIALDGAKSRLAARVDLPNQPASVAISKTGAFALTVQRPGELSVLDIKAGKVTLRNTLTIGAATSGATAVAITPDSKWALVAYRSENSVGVLPISNGMVGPVAYRIPVGRNPFSIQMAPNGRFAVVGEIASINDNPVDTVSVIDLAAEPFKVATQIETASNPEGVAISPDSQWVAVSAMNGTNFAAKSSAFNDFGLLTLYRWADGKLTAVGSAKAGHNSQGVVFSGDGKRLFVQDFMEQAISTYTVGPDGPKDTGVRIKMPGRPAAFAIGY
jgi:6-phosphogluconolactonase (cycloisomerase 2 family)